MEFHQVLVSASPGDAITSTALELRDLLRSFGQSEVYARFIDARLSDEVLPLEYCSRRVSTRISGDVLIFHMSIGEPEVTRFVMARPERLIVFYHNISPSERFLAFEPRFAGLLDAGRLELASLANKAEVGLTVSQYNANELRDAGFAKVVVAPLIVDVARLKQVTPHPGVMNHFAEMVDGPVLLFAGQMLPHKRPDLLMQVYYALVTHHLPNARLVMVGNPRLKAYAQHLDHLARELGLDRIWMAGVVSLEELVAFYRCADVFVTMSEHEGFCMPLLEAMGFELPVVARDRAAIPETVQDAGLLLSDEQARPTAAAEVLAGLMSDERLRAQLVARGRERVSVMNPDLARAQLLEAILEVS